MASKHLSILKNTVLINYFMKKIIVTHFLQLLIFSTLRETKKFKKMTNYNEYPQK